MSSIHLELSLKWDVSVEHGKALQGLFRHQHIKYKFKINCQPIKDKLRYHKIDCYALHTLTRKTDFL